LAAVRVDSVGRRLKLGQLRPSAFRWDVAFRVHPAEDLVCFGDAAVVDCERGIRNQRDDENEPGGEDGLKIQWQKRLCES
jgi:hypothetical protein